MFDADKLLGALLGSSLSRHARGSGSGGLGGLGRIGGLATPGKPALAMGLLGIAAAAYEHFSEARGQNQDSAAGPGPLPGSPPGQPATAAPPPPPGMSAAGPRPSTPPPPPGAPPSAGSLPATPPPPPATSAAADPRPSPPPPPPGAPPAAPSAANDPGRNEALVYVRGMIAAAAADGTIDDDEKQKILGQLERSGLGDEERDFMLREMDRPAGLEELIQAVRTPQQAINLYVCSLLAVEVDTEAERDHLRRLAQGLRLSPESLNAVHAHYQVSL